MKKVILITGGTSGMGLATLKELSKDESHVLLSVTRSQKRVNEAKRELGESAEQVDFVLADVTKKEECEKLAQYVEAKYGKVDGLVHGAGVMKNGGVEDQTLEEWELTLNTNLNSVFLLTKALLPLLKKSENASIVNISSIASSRAGASLAYSVSKAGVDMFTQSLAKELGKYRIRVNAVRPGIVRSNFHFTSEIFETIEQREIFLDEAKALYPLGRIGEPEDVSPMICFLLSDKAKWMTGAIITIDGGRMV